MFGDDYIFIINKLWMNREKNKIINTREYVPTYNVFHGTNNTNNFVVATSKLGSIALQSDHWPLPPESDLQPCFANCRDLMQFTNIKKSVGAQSPRLIGYKPSVTFVSKPLSLKLKYMYDLHLHTTGHRQQKNITNNNHLTIETITLKQ